MRETKRPRRPKPGARDSLIEASYTLIRERGYAATSVDELCAEAGVSKGAFFHHFENKDALAVAALDGWSELSAALFQAAPYHKHKDPLNRILSYLDFRKSMMKGEVVSFSCLAGTIVQEAFSKNDEIRAACDASISGHAASLEADIAEAMKLHGVRGKWSALSLALHIQAVLQGAFILAKAKGGPEIAAASVDHLRRYVELLFSSADHRHEQSESRAI